MKSSLCYILLICLFWQSCIKSNNFTGTSAFTIINAIPASNNLVTNFQGTGTGKTPTSFGLYITANQVGYGSALEFGNYNGITNLILVQTSDTILPLFAGTFNFKPGGIYTLFLTGTDTLHIDTLFSQDNVSYYPYNGDSLTGVRFVNLVTGSNPVSVDIQSSPDSIPVLPSLPYKALSAFQPFSANSNAMNTGYNFEFRDGSGNVLASTRLNILPFKSQTLALYGNASIGYNVMIINNY